MERKRLLIICPYPENVAPSQRLKFEQYYSYFQKEGFEIQVRPFIRYGFWKIIYAKGFFLKKIYYSIRGYLGRLKDLITAMKSDVVYIHLWATPFGLPFFEYLFRICSKKIIYDIDDLVYLKNVKSKSHRVVDFIKGRNKPLFLMKNADHVITCTPYLDEFVRRFNKNTTDISSTVDVNKYQPCNVYTNNKKLRIGWSGSLTTSRFLLVIADVLRIIVEKYNVELVIMGDPNFSIEGVAITSLPWTEKDEMKTLQSFDIGIYPLPEEEWVYGKSGLKAIQYMALGIPTIATAIGANFRVIENGISGFLVRTEQEWVEILSKLIEDAELRRRIGIDGRKRVEELFSVQKNKDKYLKILKEV
jgi:glycosyltransferase involved in cell wall biosynthesis